VIQRSDDRRTRRASRLAALLDELAPDDRAAVEAAAGAALSRRP
jgi:hypothetical protein